VTTKPRLIVISQPEDDGFIHHCAKSSYCDGGRADTGDWDEVTCPDCLIGLAQTSPFAFMGRVIRTPDYKQAMADMEARGDNFGPGFYAEGGTLVCIFTAMHGDIVSEEGEESPWVLDLGEGAGALCLGMRLRTGAYDPLLTPVVSSLYGDGWLPLNDAVPPGFDFFAANALYELAEVLKQTPSGQKLLAHAKGSEIFDAS
jgi:hypothetical protein